MSNTIQVTWSSDQQKLIADMQKRLTGYEAEAGKLKLVAEAGKAAGTAMSAAHRDAAKEISRLGDVAEKAFQKSLSPMEAHQQRLKEIRVLLRMGKIDVEQFNAANQASLKTMFKDSGATDRLKAKKAARAQELADSKAAAEQQLKIDKQEADRRLAIVKAEQDRKEKLEREAARRSLAAQKSEFMEGARIREQQMNSQERFNVKLAKYRELLKSGAIDQKTFNRAVADGNPALLQASQVTEKSGMSIGAFAARLTGIAAGYMSVTQAISMYIAANREAQIAAEEAVAKQEDLVLRYRAQAGLGAIQGKEAKNEIYKTALKTASTSEAAFGAATALVSTGFEAKDAQGAALTPFLKLISAQALTPDKAAGANEMAEAFSKFLTATGQERSGANVEKLAVAVQGLKATPMKVTDLAQLAKHASGVKELGNLSAEEMLANFAFLTNTEDSEEAGTHLREVVRQLATSGGNKKAKDQLKKMNLEPEDVDFVGEDFQTVLGRINKGVNALPEKDRATALDTLVEGRNISAFKKLAEGQGEVDKLRALMKDKAGFEADYRMTSTGKNATARRNKVAIELDDAARDADSKNDRDALRLQIRKSGMSPAVESVFMGINDLADYTFGHQNVKGGAVGIGGTNQQRMQLGIDAMMRAKEQAEATQLIRDSQKEVRNDAAAPGAGAPAVGGDGALVDALKENTAATKAATQQPIEVRVGGAKNLPPRPVAAAGLAGGN